MTTFFAAAAAATGCSDSEEESPGLPPREHADAGPSCENHDPVDDRPDCDECVREKCCAYVVACDDTPSCKQIQECLAACTDPQDFTCPLTCSASNPRGSEVLQEVGACAQSECKSQCPAPDLQGGGFEDAF